MLPSGNNVQIRHTKFISFKLVVCVSLIWLLLTCVTRAADDEKLNFYSHTVMDINENVVSLTKYKGKVSLVVNVASECGYTDNHYKSLVRLQELLGPTGKFNVLAFPCNQFGQQEPKSNAAIYRFAKKTYSVNFPMFAKVHVKGQDALDAYTFLIEQSKKVPQWNFWKYLVSHEGQVLEAWGPWVDPDKLFNTISHAVNDAIAADSGNDESSQQLFSRDKEL
ncbi:glutathione peroxidase 7-like [Pomacea canaliculata]|uniref:glutathione peroxidase 7-like n=1 Tax=Pomacea canaliculata TaxID=400727 RepID=UPI000D72B313|nr:glutathione peroxidase 7-like [Pomacea canaliculata]AYH91726.1 glutathione peroxidase 7-like protein [Pomacea canaliculata]